MILFELPAGSPIPSGYRATTCPVRGTLLVSLGDEASRVAELRRDWQLAQTCELCPLHAGRRHVVYGKGDPLAASGLFLIGEAPGADEDEQGVPFVGQAGKLLDRAAGEAGVDLATSYVSNVCKCRPPENRTPHPPEAQACLSTFLHRQLLLVRPRVVVLLGGTAARALDPSIQSILRDRGRVRNLRVPEASSTSAAGTVTYPALAVNAVPTVHPAYVLRTPQAYSDLVADLRLAQRWAR